MRSGIVLATALIIAVSATTSTLAANVKTSANGVVARHGVAQQCLTDLRKFDSRLAEVGIGTLATGGIAPPSDYYVWGEEGTPRQKLQAWWNAAYLFAMDGDERSCQSILASMQNVYRDHQKLVGNESDDLAMKDAWRRAHLARAKPVSSMDHLMRAEGVIGAEIRNLKDQRLGRIEDIVFNPDQQDIRYVIVSRGGFLGFDEKWIAVRWNDLRATEDHDLYVLDVSPKAIADAPPINRRTFATTAGLSWQQSLNQYWDRVLK